VTHGSNKMDANDPNRPIVLAMSRAILPQILSVVNQKLPEAAAKPLRAYMRLMSEAMQAAPKPLSILTTDTLGEHVLSMPSSAAMPPKDAP
jgi:hypothetical protein